MTVEKNKTANLKTFLILGLVAAGIAYFIGDTTYVYRSVYLYPNERNSSLPEFYAKDTVVIYPNQICRFYMHQTPLTMDGANYIRKEVKVSSLKELNVSSIDSLVDLSFPDEAPKILETKFIKTTKEIRHALGWLVGFLLIGVVVQLTRKFYGTHEE